MNTSLLRLFVVDRNPHAHLWLDVAIRRSGLPVELGTAENGREAIEYLQKSTAASGVPSVDVILTDLNGLDWIQTLKSYSRLSGIPAVICTPSDDLKDVARARAKGASAYIVKPPNPNDYGEVIEKLYLSWSRSELAMLWPPGAPIDPAVVEERKKTDFIYKNSVDQRWRI